MSLKATPLQSIAPKLPAGLLYGGDYNPEQWPEDVWLEDARLMREAGVNLVSVAIFSWAKLEPREGSYDFGWLDRVVDLLWSNGISTCLANATASPPPWFSRAYPESLPVDVEGVRLSIGSRQHYCVNSKDYRRAAAALTRKLVARYQDHPGVALWHVNNEIGCHSFECYCDVCAGDFRQWLKSRYRSIDALNHAWGTAFWSQGYGDWEEIFPPRKTLTFRNPTHVLDYRRFMNDSMRDLLVNEVEAIRSTAPEAKVSTNGLTFWRTNDYWEWYRHVDIAAWDAYPDPALGLSEVQFSALNHDVFRSLKGGQPFILMEQAASQVNWRPFNRLKAPGQMRALSWQAVAHGADGVMFFQWRAAKAGAEKFHSAMVPHGGADTRVFREIVQLGDELKKHPELAGTRAQARVALVLSWENRWALETESKPTNFDYQEIVSLPYAALWNTNVGVDFVPPGAPLEAYDLVVVPGLYLLTSAQAETLRRFVERGGTLVVTYFSGVADENDHIGLGGYPALLRDVLGMSVEEWQPLAPGAAITFKTLDDNRTHPCTKLCETLKLKEATALAVYDEDWFAGTPAITRNTFGKGEAYYIGTHVDLTWLTAFFRERFRGHGLHAPATASAGVELAVRSSETDSFLFVINHRNERADANLGEWSGEDLLSGRHLTGDVRLEPFAVHLFRRARGEKTGR